MRTVRHRSSIILSAVVILVMAVLFALLGYSRSTASAEESESAEVSGYHYVIIYDKTEKLSIKTDAVTVSEALERAGLELSEYDTVEPAADTIITSETFYINIYRAHPAVVSDGATRKYVMTTSYDPQTVAEAAGFTIYDGDEVTTESSTIATETTTDFLESGAAPVYVITRNGGRTITVEESIPYTERTETDYTLAQGTSKVTQVGEDGRKVLKYQVNFVDGVEVSRELISEEVIVEPVEQVTAVGAQASVAPGQETCAAWAREAGVSEVDLTAALTLIYRESGCRVNAQNSSSGAYGIPQALPGNKMAQFGSDWQTNPVTQIKWMAYYVTNRYGGWSAALQHSNSYGWY